MGVGTLPNSRLATEPETKFVAVKTVTEKTTDQKAVVEKAAAVVKVISSQILDTVCEMERIGE